MTNSVKLIKIKLLSFITGRKIIITVFYFSDLAVSGY